MTSASNPEDQAEHVLELARGPDRRRPLPARRTAATMAALLGLAVLAAGCGGSHGPGIAGSSSGGLAAQFLAYARCMRSHGVSDFPDPATSGGGVGIVLQGGPGSDLNPNNPRFKAANQACRSLQPAAHPAPTPSGQKIGAEVRWARCLRAHGLPNFPDPNGQGAFDSSKFDDSSPAFQTARNACRSLEAAVGSVQAVPGSSSGP
jgi:hypothetical protein